MPQLADGMTRAKALDAMRKGEKITHKYFAEDEYIHMEDGEILTDDGFSYHNTFYRHQYFKNGWSVYQKITANGH